MSPGKKILIWCHTESALLMLKSSTEESLKQKCKASYNPKDWLDGWPWECVCPHFCVVLYLKFNSIFNSLKNHLHSTAASLFYYSTFFLTLKSWKIIIALKLPLLEAWIKPAESALLSGHENFQVMSCLLVLSQQTTKIRLQMRLENESAEADQRKLWSVWGHV